MSVLNPLARELSVKIVYYGPGLSGKTTSLQCIHDAVAPDRRGKMVSLATRTDRTLFFDFLPLQVERIGGLGVRFQLYTVPGQVFYAATRKLVLKNADGVVFVADSQPGCRDSNVQSLADLHDNLREHGMDPERTPLLFQYNKRDLPDVMSVEQMAADLNPKGLPAIATSASTGEGVLDGLHQVSRLVVHKLVREHRAAESMALKRDFESAREGGSEGGIVASMAAAAATASREVLARPSSRAPSPQAVDDSSIRRTRELELVDLLEAEEKLAGLAGPTASVHDAPTDRPSSDDIEALDGGISFAALWPEAGRLAVREVERYIHAGRFGTAVERCNALLAELLAGLPGPDANTDPGVKANLLGLDGRQYLRVCRLDSMPEEAIGHTDALFALHVLVSAQLKRAGI